MTCVQILAPLSSRYVTLNKSLDLSDIQFQIMYVEMRFRE